MSGIHRLVVPLALIVSLLLSLGLPLPAAAVSAATPRFADIAGHWAAGVVTRAADLGLVGGYPDGTFHPNSPVTRAEFVKMVVQVRGLPLPSPLPDWTRQPVKYGLVDAMEHWVTTQGYLPAAMGAGLIEPSDYPAAPQGGQLFDPDRPITRLEVAEIAARVLGKQGAAMVLRGAPLPFKDVIPDWASGSVAVMNSTGVMSGYPDGTFGPGRTLTRAEAAAIAVRLLTTAAAEGTVKPPASLPSQPARSVPIWEANSWQVETVAAPARPAYVFSEQTYLAAAPDGTLYLAEGGQIWRFAAGESPAGGGATLFYQGITGPLAVGPDGSLYMAAYLGYQILRFDADGKPTPWAGSGQDAYADGSGTSAGFRRITGLCADSHGNLYAMEFGGLLRKVDPHGNVTTLAGVTPLQAAAIYPPGNGVGPSEGPGYLATLGSDINNTPCAVDAQGNVYLADLRGAGIRRVAPDGTVSWLAGNRWYGGYADGLAAEAQFRNIAALTTDAYGDLWVADAGNQRIRRVTPDGHVYTVVGGGLVPMTIDSGMVIGYKGADVDGRGLLAQLNNPAGLAVANGRLYLAQSSGSLLRVVTGSAASYPEGWAAVPFAGVGLTPTGSNAVKVAPGPVTLAVALYTPVSLVQMAVDRTVTDGGNPIYTMGWDASDAAPGAHEVKLEAQRPDGSWTREGGLTVQVDPTYNSTLYPTHYALVTPGDGSWVRGQVPITIVGDGITQSISIDGKPLITDNTRVIGVTWDSTIVPDGVHTLGLTHYAPEQGKTYTDDFSIHVINHSAPRREDDLGPRLRVYLNGQLHIYGLPPRLVNGVPYLPFTETLQQFGFQVTWDSGKRTLTAQKGDRILTLNVDTGAVTATQPQQSYTLVHKPIIVLNSTLAPWTLFTDATGTNSSWQPDESTVRIGF